MYTEGDYRCNQLISLILLFTSDSQDKLETKLLWLIAALTGCLNKGFSKTQPIHCDQHYSIKS